jgi:hypothetical protein
MIYDIKGTLLLSLLSFLLLLLAMLGNTNTRPVYQSLSYRIIVYVLGLGPSQSTSPSTAPTRLRL